MEGFCQQSSTDIFLVPLKFRTDSQASLSQFNPLIEAFLESPALVNSSSHLLDSLEHTQKRIPEVTIRVCEEFLRRLSAEARDIRTAAAGNDYTVGTLVFRAYDQLSDQNSRRRLLNLIDQMCLEGLHSSRQGLLAVER